MQSRFYTQKLRVLFFCQIMFPPNISPCRWTSADQIMFPGGGGYYLGVYVHFFLKTYFEIHVLLLSRYLWADMGVLPVSESKANHCARQPIQLLSAPFHWHQPCRTAMTAFTDLCAPSRCRRPQQPTPRPLPWSRPPRGLFPPRPRPTSASARWPRGCSSRRNWPRPFPRL